MALPRERAGNRRLVVMDRKAAVQLRQWAADYAVAVWGQAAAFASTARPGVLAEGDSTKPLLVLIPGVYESWRFMLPLARKLNLRGYRVLPVPGLGDNRRPVTRGAALVSAELERIAARAGAELRSEHVVLVGHSKGGLIGKQVLLDQEERRASATAEQRSSSLEVLGLVAVATPFRGSRYAALARSRTLREFSPDSETVLRLAAREEVNHRIVSVLPSFDPHIPGARDLPGSVERILLGTGHFRVLSSAEGLEAVVAGIESLQAR